MKNYSNLCFQSQGDDQYEFVLVKKNGQKVTFSVK